MRFTFLILFVVLLTAARAQTTVKLYIDDNRQFTDSAKANFYEVYTDSGDTITRAGTTDTYFMNGKRLKHIDYKYDKDGRRREKETYYYDNGQLASMTNAVESNLDGEQVYYFPNNKIKCKALFVEGQFMNGKCYTSAGKDTAYYEGDYRMPVFPGGPQAMRKFIAGSLKYPAEAKARGLTGTVKVDASIDKYGNLSRVAIRESVDPILDQEAVRIINSMPKWIPNVQKDRLFSKYEVIPVVFELKKK